MASARRRKSFALIEQLAAEPFRFDFFQSVRILERWARTRPEDVSIRHPIGADHPPAEEAVRFRAYVSHRFPPGAVQSLRMGGVESGPPEMTVGFLGMIGPSGVLPQHYTQLAIDRVRQKDTALRDFFDIFHHRLISLFFRAWEKYRFPLGYERAIVDPSTGESDLFTETVFCLAGMGTGGLRGRLEIDDAGFLYYAGLMGQKPPAAISLELLVQDYFNLPAAVLQFQGQWLYLSTPDQSKLSHAPGWIANNQLGTNVVAGQRVWGVENRFRVCLGPLGYDHFRRLMPNGDLLLSVAQLVRTFVGPDFDFDIQPILRAAEVPACKLGGHDETPAQLGWNTWVLCGASVRDADEAVFLNEGMPTDDGLPKYGAYASQVAL